MSEEREYVVSEQNGAAIDRSQQRSPSTQSIADDQRPLSIEDLYTIGGSDPPTPRISTPVSQTMQQEIRQLYLHEYAHGIDAFFETTWYSTSGLDRLFANEKLLSLFAGMLELFKATESSDYDKMRLMPLTESRLIWMLMSMPRTMRMDGISNEEVRQQLDVVLKRLEVFECLITGRTGVENPLLGTADVAETTARQSSTHAPVPAYQHHNLRRLRFWQTLGAFTALPRIAQGPRMEALSAMRLLLDRIESRDVLYSMAVVQHYGAAAARMHLQGDGVEKLLLRKEQHDAVVVAKLFLENQAGGSGMTQVVQRVCAMAVRSWGAAK